MCTGGDARQPRLGEWMLDLVSELMPIHRSVAGPGNVRSLEVLQRIVPLEFRRVPSGGEVFGWTVPRPWQVRDAFVADAQGQRVIDYRACNLHLVNRSQPVDVTLPWSQLRDHLHTDPARPNWVPYRSAYRSGQWGFCLTHDDYMRLEARGDLIYRACIDAKFDDGDLVYGEYAIAGAGREEVLVSTHICHPSMANDNTAAMVLAAVLAAQLGDQAPRRLGYRFLFLPATIGAIAWLHGNRQRLDRIVGGLVLSTIGDAGPFTYKRSRRGQSRIDLAAPAVLERLGKPYSVRPFTPLGYDQRQFCSPGFNLPIGGLMRTPYGEYAQYHTSGDDISLLSAASLVESLEVSATILVSDELSHGTSYQQPPAGCDGSTAPTGGRAEGPMFINLHPCCEPPLGKHDLYQPYGQAEHPDFQQAVLWMLNYSDGQHDVQQISELAGIEPALLIEAASRLVDVGLLAPASRRMTDATHRKWSQD